MTGSPGDKRQSLRIQPFIVPCRVLVGATRVPAYLTDLSPQGARVTCDEAAPAAGTTVELEVRFGRRAAWSRLRGSVKWVNAAGEVAGSFGITFEGLGPEEKQLVDSVLEEFKRRAAELA